MSIADPFNWVCLSGIEFGFINVILFYEIKGLKYYLFAYIFLVTILKVSRHITE